MTQPLRVAIVGAGHLGKIHARLMRQHSQARLVGVVDPCPTAREQVEQALQVDTFAEIDAILPICDAAIVAAPTSLHAAIGATLLEHGKHVLMEKPLTPTAAESERLVQLAAKQRCILQVGHVERFNPAFRAAQLHVDRPDYIESRRWTGCSFRSMDVGVVLDLMIHDIDLILALVDSDIVRVQAWGTSLLGNHEDVAQARLEFHSGCVANLSASRVSPRAVRAMDIYCRGSHTNIDFSERTIHILKQSAEVRGANLDFTQASETELQTAREQLFEVLLPNQHVAVAEGNPIVEEQADFFEAIDHGRMPRVTGHDGRNAVAVAERICESIAAHASLHVADETFAPTLVPRSDPAPAAASSTVRNFSHRRKAG